MRGRGRGGGAVGRWSDVLLTALVGRARVRGGWQDGAAYGGEAAATARLTSHLPLAEDDCTWAGSDARSLAASGTATARAVTAAPPPPPHCGGRPQDGRHAPPGPLSSDAAPHAPSRGEGGHLRQPPRPPSAAPLCAAEGVVGSSPPAGRLWLGFFYCLACLPPSRPPPAIRLPPSPGICRLHRGRLHDGRRGVAPPAGRHFARGCDDVPGRGGGGRKGGSARRTPPPCGAPRRPAVRFVSVRECSLRWDASPP